MSEPDMTTSADGQSAEARLEDAAYKTVFTDYFGPEAADLAVADKAVQDLLAELRMAKDDLADLTAASERYEADTKARLARQSELEAALGEARSFIQQQPIHKERCPRQGHELQEGNMTLPDCDCGAWKLRSKIAAALNGAS